MISVITPVFNGERFIESCIKVVIDQHCSSVEHIIVDGGSNDCTVKIIKQYADQYPHIRWISEKDKGQSDAMNKGIKLAKGQIIAILNVDDYYEPKVLNHVEKIFETLPVPTLLVGNCNIWDDAGHLITINRPKKLALFDLLLGFNINPFPANPSAYFYHTDLHESIGFYKTDDHYCMDLDFILRAVQFANKKYVDEIWGNFRQLKNTKTFERNVSGEALKMRENIYRFYRKDLPFYQRIVVAIRYENRLTSQIKFFLSFSARIFPKFKKMLLKALDT